MIPSISSVTIGTGIPVVLLHAFPLSHLMWQEIHPPPGYCLVLPDFPGFGLSPISHIGLSLAEAAKGLENHLQEKGINEPFTLGGVSMGGYWAMEYIRQFPTKVSKVIFISTRPSLDKPEAKQNRINMAERVTNEGVGFLASAMIPGLIGKTALADKTGVIQRLRNWIQTLDPVAIALAQHAMAERRDQKGLLTQIKASVLLMAGKEDSLISANEVEFMAKAIPKCQLRVLEKAGHLIPLEDPVQFQKILNDFISESN